MKKDSLSLLVLLGVLFISFTLKAQMPKTLPIDFLDKNSSVSYSFNLNETPAQKKTFIDQFTGFLLAEGLNLVKEDEKINNPTEAQKAQYYKDVDSLKIAFDVIVVLSTKYFIFIYQQNPKSTKLYQGTSFAQCFEALKKDLASLKEKNPGINQAPYDASLLKRITGSSSEETADSTADETGPEFTFSDKATFIDHLPEDLAKSTLLVLLFDELEVSPEDVNKISAEELERRRARTERLKNKNIKYKARFEEYPYPILFVLPKDLPAASENHRYLLVDRYKRGLRTTETTTKSTTQGIRNTTVSHHNSQIIYHNYCIRDNKSPDTYYRLTKWIDCEKGGEIFCLKRFIKGVINADAE